VNKARQIYEVSKDWKTTQLEIFRARKGRLGGSHHRFAQYGEALKEQLPMGMDYETLLAEWTEVDSSLHHHPFVRRHGYRKSRMLRNLCRICKSFLSNMPFPICRVIVRPLIICNGQRKSCRILICLMMPAYENRASRS
jgi:hypothetical protein